MKGYLLFFFSLLPFLAIAQTPVISSVSESSGSVNLEVGISGTGFNATPSNNVVRFGAAEATVLTATTTFLEVSVPAGTSIASISVTNTASGRTGYSNGLFFLNYSGNGLTPAPTDISAFPSTQELLDLDVADFDKDGKNDVVATKIDGTATDLIIFQNTAVGNTISFSKLDNTTNPELNISDPSSGVAQGDIDGDGKTDFVITRAGASRTEISVFRNISTVGSIKFAAAKSYFVPASHLTRAIKIRDIDGDGKPEVIVTNTANNELSIFKNNSTKGSINLAFVPTVIQVGNIPNTSGLSVEDINADGKPDLVVVPFLDKDVYVMRNQSTGLTFSFAAPIILPVTGNLNSVVVGDLNNDGKNDIVVTKTVQNEMAVLLNTSDNTGISFQNAQDFPTSTSPWGLDLVDFDGNGFLDVLVTSTTDNSYTYYKNESTGSLILNRLNFTQTDNSRSVKAADFSNDGKPDLAFTSFNSTGPTYNMTVVRNDWCFQPLILQGSDITICTGQTVTLEATSALDVTYVWTKDAVEVKMGPDNFLDITTAGIYVCTAKTESDNCIIASATLTAVTNAATAPPNPTASNDGPGCIGSSATLSTAAVAGMTYDWTGPNGFMSTDQNPVLSALTTSMGGLYEVTLINPEGCRSDVPGETILEVIVPPDFTIGSTDPDNFCVGNSATLAVGPVSNYSYQWLLDGTAIPGATSDSYDAGSAGSYTMQATSLVNACVVVSEPYLITTFPPPTALFAKSGELCSSSAITFINTSTTDIALPATYLWDFGDGTTDTSPDSVSHTFASTGSFTVTLTVDYTGQVCTDSYSETMNIAAATPFIIDIGGQIPFCVGDSVVLSVPGSFNSYLWNNGSTSPSLVAQTDGNYSVTAVNTNGCSSSDNIDVTTNPLPIITLAAEKDIITIGESVQLTATGAISYVWIPGESLSDSTIADPIATPTLTTTYTVTGIDGNGCIGESQLLLTVQDAGDALPVIAPKLFSPNGDGFDDFWVIENMLNFPDCKIVVFDRNGSTIFEAEPYVNDWDGTNLSGSDVPEGPYFYVISCNDGKSASGSISIIR